MFDASAIQCKFCLVRKYASFIRYLFSKMKTKLHPHKYVGQIKVSSELP